LRGSAAFDHTGLTLSWSEGADVKRSRFLEPLLAGSAAAGGATVGGAAARGAAAVPLTAAPRNAFTTTAAPCVTAVANVDNGIGQLAAAPRFAPAAPAPTHVAPAAPAAHFSQQALEVV